ncbi:MAG: FHA domain-containing protein [Xenococcaceae cyanobacterium]
MSNSQQFRHILVIEAPKYKRTVDLQATTYSVGRHRSNSIVILDQCVSRYHATLLCIKSPESNDYSFSIIDGNLNGTRSKNGIFINGEKQLSKKIQHGDLIYFGKIKAKYHITDNEVLDESMTGNFEEDLWADF